MHQRLYNMFIRTINNIGILRKQKVLVQAMKNYTSATQQLTRIEFTDGIKKITMCNQKTRNALSLSMMENLIYNIKNDEDNPELRIIIITGEGPIFSAGHNLKELIPEAGRQHHESVFKLASKLMCTLIDSPVPVLARVDGLAAAAGCQLVAQCDIAICSESSQFSTPGVNFGIFCSTPGVALARTINKMAAMNMLLTGIPITASDAKACGLVTKVCQKENLDKEIQTTCDAIISKSRDVIELGKKFYYKQIHHDVRKAYELGGVQMVENLQLEDGKEGIKSFVEKRKPAWRH